MAEQKVKCGEGSLSMNKRGGYEYKVYIIDIDKKKKRKTFFGQDADTAIMKANEYIKYVEDVNNGVESLATIPQILKRRYELDYRNGYTQEPGYYRNLASLKKIEDSALGKIPIAKVTMLDIDNFLGTLRTYSNSVIRKTFGQLRLAYGEAMIAEIITKNLMDSSRIRCPKSAIPDTKVKALTVEEQHALVEVLQNHKRKGKSNVYAPQLLIELYTGMRMGEINALRPEDIDFEKNVIHIRGTISMGIDWRIFRRSHTKTDAGMRDVPLNNLVRPILEKAIADMKWNKEGLIFYDYNKNDVISTQQVNCYYRRACIKAGITYYGQHSLRHTFATRCIEAGVQPVVLKNWLGHTDIHITLDTYADIYGSLNSASLDQLEEHLKS